MGPHSNGSASQKEIESLPVIDHVAENKLVRKLDLMIVPPVMLLYLFSFLDRVSQVHHSQWPLPNSLPGEHRECTLIRDRGGSRSRQGQISNSCLASLRYVCAVRNTFKPGHQEVSSVSLDRRYHRRLGHCCNIDRPCSKLWRLDRCQIDSWSIRSWPLSWYDHLPDSILHQERAGFTRGLPLRLCCHCRICRGSACVWNRTHGRGCWTEGLALDHDT